MLPFAVGIGLVIVFHVTGAPGKGLDLNYLVDQFRGLRVEHAALLVGSILVVAVIVQPHQFELLQLFEGYWNRSWPGVGRLYDSCMERQRRSRRALAAVSEPEFGGKPGSEEEVGEAEAQMRLFFPTKDRLLPTRLGNVLRAAEDRAGSRYGLEAVVVWPRLYVILPERILEILTEQRNQLDLAVRMCTVLLVVALIETIVLVADPVGLLARMYWLLMPTAILGLAGLSYRASVGAALAYGQSVETAFDLYRFDLLSALHLPLPLTHAQELISCDNLSDFLRLAKDEGDFRFRYRHNEPKTGTSGVSPT